LEYLNSQNLPNALRRSTLYWRLMLIMLRKEICWYDERWCIGDYSYKIHRSWLSKRWSIFVSSSLE
jgi:hypothetical protein